MMDFVFGWVKVKPGTRHEFMKMVPDHVARQRAVPGVYWLEFHESFDDADVIIFTAGFASAEAHAAQVVGDAQIIAKLEEIGVEARFENISADTKRLDVLNFDGTARDQQLAQPAARSA